MRVYLPYDYPFAVHRFLSHFQPCVGILLETEIWFNLIHTCHLREIPLLLLNARLSEKSLKNYARFPNLIRKGLQQLHTIAAQTKEDADRLHTLGAVNVSIMGNLKFDIEPPYAMLELGMQLRTLLGAERKIFLAASTREGEEILILAALKDMNISNLLTIIVPRHPQRFEEVATLIENANFKFQRRSNNEAIHPDTQVVLGDSMGEMFAYFVACDMAFIGGSLLPFGGQNLIEASAVGKPVLIGPNTYNFNQASQLATECGAARRIADTQELLQAVKDLFSKPEQMQAMSGAGFGFVKSNQGATEKALALVSNALISSPPH
jgi:3-deoxy-D-manno-octulosonic-acid transferase